MIYPRREKIKFKRKILTFSLLLLSFIFLVVLAIKIFLSALITFS